MIVAETFWKVLCRDGAHRSLVTACRSSASVVVTLHVRAWEPCAWWLLPKGTGHGTGPELGHGIPLSWVVHTVHSACVRRRFVCCHVRCCHSSSPAPLTEVARSWHVCMAVSVGLVTWRDRVKDGWPKAHDEAGVSFLEGLVAVGE